MNEHYYDKNILSDDLVLLNDKLVTERLSDEVSSDFGVPTVASHGLVQRVYSKLDSRDNEISGYAQDISATAKISAEVVLESINTANDNITALCASAADVGKFNFEYNKSAQKIYIRMESATGVSSVKSIDTSDFIKDGMVDNAYFTPSRPDPEHPGQSLTGRWICIVFNTSAGKDPVYVDVDKLVPIVGDGLSTSTSADNQAMINVDWTKVARAETLIKTVKFVGEIAVQEDSELSTYLQNQAWITEDRLENGAWIAVSSLAETKEMTLNGVSCVIENGDYLVVHDKRIENQYVKIEDLTLNDTLYIVRSNVTYAGLSAISSDLDQRLTAEIIRAKAAETQLQENINDEIARAEEAESRLENDLSQETIRAMSAEIYLSNEVSSEVTRAQTVEDGLSAEISSCSVSCDNLCAIIAAEVARAFDIEGRISSEVSSIPRVKVLSSYDIEALSGVEYADALSVVNVTNDEYNNLVADEKIKDTMLYVIKDDYLDARGQCLKNLADPVELSDAVNKAYVDGRTDGIKSVLNDLAVTLSMLVSDPSQNPTLDDIVKTIIGKLSAV